MRENTFYLELISDISELPFHVLLVIRGISCRMVKTRGLSQRKPLLDLAVIFELTDLGLGGALQLVLDLLELNLHTLDVLRQLRVLLVTVFV